MRGEPRASRSTEPSPADLARRELVDWCERHGLPVPTDRRGHAASGVSATSPDRPVAAVGETSGEVVGDPEPSDLADQDHVVAAVEELAQLARRPTVHAGDPGIPPTSSSTGHRPISPSGGPCWRTPGRAPPGRREHVDRRTRPASRTAPASASRGPGRRASAADRARARRPRSRSRPAGPSVAGRGDDGHAGRDARHRGAELVGRRCRRAGTHRCAGRKV